MLYPFLGPLHTLSRPAACRVVHEAPWPDSCSATASARDLTGSPKPSAARPRRPATPRSPGEARDREKRGRHADGDTDATGHGTRPTGRAAAENQTGRTPGGGDPVRGAQPDALPKVPATPSRGERASGRAGAVRGLFRGPEGLAIAVTPGRAWPRARDSQPGLPSSSPPPPWPATRPTRRVSPAGRSPARVAVHRIPARTADPPNRPAPADPASPHTGGGARRCAHRYPASAGADPRSAGRDTRQAPAPSYPLRPRSRRACILHRPRPPPVKTGSRHRPRPPE